MFADKLILRVVIQRVSAAEVFIAGQTCGKMNTGLVVLFGVGGLTASQCGSASAAELLEAYSKKSNSDAQAVKAIQQKCAEKILGLRIFSDSEGKMNCSLKDIDGSMYFVSQFTLFADCKKGFRPGFSQAAHPEIACEIYEECSALFEKNLATDKFYTGKFAADMDVSLVNSGPVTLCFDVTSAGIA